MQNLTIEVKGQFISKSSKNAGSVGSANSADITVVFDEEWSGFAKRIIWLDARGENKKSVILVPDVKEQTTIYKTTIPPDVMKIAGWCSFSVEGYYEASPDIVLKSVSDRLFVAHSHTEEGGDYSADEIMQLQKEFENLMPRVSSLMEDTKKDLAEICENLNVWEKYDSAKTYKNGNKVTYKGECYVCLHTVKDVSPENEDFWRKR